MSNNKKVRKQGHPRVVVLVLTILVLAAAAGCYVYSQRITQQGEEILAQRRAEVEAINEQRQQEYMLAVSEFQQQNTSGANLAWPAPKAEGWDVVELDNYPLESVKLVGTTRADVMAGGMLLVNEWHSRPDDFEQIEPQIVSVTTYTEHKVAVQDSSVKAFPIAINALQECLTAAKAQGYDYFCAWAGYRSWENQNERFQKEMDKHKDSLSGEDLIAKAKKTVNYPGTSEYNSGLTMDLKLYKRNDADFNGRAFYETDEGLWMYNNSWRYGLVFRFPLADYPLKGTADKSYKTGVSVKLNAYRYVGKGNAAVMHIKDLCMEEYIEYLMEHPHIAVFENGALRYEIYREFVGDASSFSFSVVGSRNLKSYTTSMDNMGCVISVFEY